MSNPKMAGYSGTPLAKKLGIKAESKVYLLGSPEGYLELLEPLPEGVEIVKRFSNSTDIIHVFATQKSALEKNLCDFREKINSGAALWVSWPKKAAKVPTDISESTIRDIALPMGFVDIKVCAINEIWSGLKLVIRKELR
jgi:hypothetical protein